VRPLGLFNLVDARGPQLERAETVTILNDLVILAPSRLLDPTVRLEAIDATSARVHFTRGAETVTAELRFDAAGQLIDFVSDDRLKASSDGTGFTAYRWSTPLREPTAFDGRLVSRLGEAWWHEPTGAYAYGEFTLQTLEFD
jgi:hypothetical protein